MKAKETKNAKRVQNSMDSENVNVNISLLLSGAVGPSSFGTLRN